MGNKKGIGLMGKRRLVGMPAELPLTAFYSCGLCWPSGVTGQGEREGTGTSLVMTVSSPTAHTTHLLLCLFRNMCSMLPTILSYYKKLEIYRKVQTGVNMTVVYPSSSALMVVMLI